ncbi:hypothetical protein DL96DRAFT_1599840 [Flagelloscypha sp. PMI_526]|nr:hypothetical protein DL96DRAFT_1599840 [Flagelloscypha sp. PMI_526]
MSLITIHPRHDDHSFPTHLVPLIVFSCLTALGLIVFVICYAYARSRRPLPPLQERMRPTTPTSIQTISSQTVTITTVTTTDRTSMSRTLGSFDEENTPHLETSSSTVSIESLRPPSYASSGSRGSPRTASPLRKSWRPDDFGRGMVDVNLSEPIGRKKDEGSVVS